MLLGPAHRPQAPEQGSLGRPGLAMKLGTLRLHLGLPLFCCGIWGVARRETRPVPSLPEKEVVLGAGAAPLSPRPVRCPPNPRQRRTLGNHHI